MEIYIWNGNLVTPAHREVGFYVAGLIKNAFKRPPTTQIITSNQGFLNKNKNLQSIELNQ